MNLVQSLVLIGIITAAGNSLTLNETKTPKNTLIENENLYNTLNKSNMSQKYSERHIRELRSNNDTWKEENNSKINYTYKMYEVTRFNRKVPSRHQIDRAWRLYNRTFEFAKRNELFEYENARNQGFKNKFSSTHFVNIGHYRDNSTLDPNEPEFLIYKNNSDNERMLAGVMYMQNGVKNQGKQVGGPLTLWHYHTYPEKRCFYTGYAESKIENCPEKYISDVSPEMLHVWFIEKEGGVFETKMYVPNGKSLEPRKLSKSEFVKKYRDQ